MDKVIQVINILEQHADATVAGSTVAMAISAMLTLMATVAIVAAARSTARGTKQLAKIAEREEEARKTPDVVVWLKPEFGGTIPLLNIVVGNVGTGVARDVRWWFQNVDREDWKVREIMMIWPDGPETAPSIDVLMPGEKFEMTMGGPSLVVPDRRLYPHVKTETPMKPFDVEVRFRNMAGEDMGMRTYTCEVQKLRNTGGRATHPLHRIADALEKATGGPKYFGESPGIGQPASEADEIRHEERSNTDPSIQEEGERAQRTA